MDWVSFIPALPWICINANDSFCIKVWNYCVYAAQLHLANRILLDILASCSFCVV